MTIEICHFCEKDYTLDNHTYLLEGPAREVNMCEICVDRANSIIDNNYENMMSHHRCNMCGDIKETWFYGCSPFVCFDCIQTMSQLVQLAKRVEHAY